MRNNDDLSILNIYLDEIKKFPLLTQEEEIKLALTIRTSDNLEEVKKAREKFAYHNLRLVVSIAKKFLINNMDINDLIQAGNEGLMIAIDKFDPSLGFKFSTYATYWIRQCIYRFIQKTKSDIRIPVPILDLIEKYKKIFDFFSQKLGREPSLDEFADYLGEDTEKIEKLFKIDSPIASLDSKVTDQDGEKLELKDTIQDDSCSVLEEVIRDDLISKIEELFKKCKLSETEIEILKLRYGFYDNIEFTLEDIGKKFHITKEGIRKKIESILKKIRTSKYIKEFLIHALSSKEVEENIDEYRKIYIYCKRPYKIH